MRREDDACLGGSRDSIILIKREARLLEAMQVDEQDAIITNPWCLVHPLLWRQHYAYFSPRPQFVPAPYTRVAIPSVRSTTSIQTVQNVLTQDAEFPSEHAPQIRLCRPRGTVENGITTSNQGRDELAEARNARGASIDSLSCYPVPML